MRRWDFIGVHTESCRAKSWREIGDWVTLSIFEILYSALFKSDDNLNFLDSCEV